MAEEPFPIPPEFVPPPPEAPVRPPVVTAGSASAAPPMPQVPSTAQGQQPSMLDRLRQQVMQDIMPNEAADMQRRLRTFGAAMMGTPGNFFQGVAAGQKAIEDQRLAEQQARTQRVRSAEEDAYRQAQIQLKEAEQRYNQDPTNPHNVLYLAQAQQAMGMADYYRQGGRGAGERGQLTERDILNFRPNIRSRVEREVRNRYSGQLRPPDPAVLDREIDERTDQEVMRALTMLRSRGSVSAEQLMSGLNAGQAGPPQGPQEQRTRIPLTGTPRPAPTGQ